jgi:hypothetical protein
MYICNIVQVGDVLFIPSLWFHNVVSLDFSVAVNVFWRSLPKEMYDPKDTYGNKDPLPVNRAHAHICICIYIHERERERELHPQILNVSR